MKDFIRLRRFLCCCVAFCLLFMVVPVPVTAEEAAVPEVVETLFSGEKTGAAWSTVLTVNSPDTSLLCAEHLLRVRCDANAAPALVLASWSGGASWATVSPCKNINGDLLYAYADMVASFGADLSLVDAISISAKNAAVTVYQIDVVTEASVLAAEQGTAGVRRVVGYLPDWSYSVYQSLDFTALTHLNIAFCNPDAAGALSCGIPDAALLDLLEQAHRNNVQVLISLGGAGGAARYPALTADTASMTAFNARILEYCQRYGFDGIDLDIEADVDAVFWDTYEAWCLSLRAVCDANQLLLTTATAPWVSRFASRRALDCFDFLNIMAYDNDGDAQTHSGYAFAEDCLSFFQIERGISVDRLVLGVPFYGRGYDADGKLSWTSYVSFSELVASDPANYHRDSYEGVAYNSAETIAKKCALARDYGGIMIWELSQDAAGEHSLLRVIAGELLTEAPVRGDVNGDGVCDAADVRLLLSALTGGGSLTAAQGARADVSGDQRLNAFDLVLLKQTILQAAA